MEKYGGPGAEPPENFDFRVQICKIRNTKEKSGAQPNMKISKNTYDHIAVQG